MTRRMITMNVETREISFTDLTPQELAELQAITDDYLQRFGAPRLFATPNHGDEAFDEESTPFRTIGIAG